MNLKSLRTLQVLLCCLSAMLVLLFACSPNKSFFKNSNQHNNQIPGLTAPNDMVFIRSKSEIE